MKNFRMLAADLPVTPLLERLEMLPGLWHTGRARSVYAGSAHGAAEAILVRWPEELTLEAGFRCLQAIDQPAGYTLMPEIGALTFKLAERVGRFEDTGRCIITRLVGGGRIAPHIDEGPYADAFDRFHVCLAGDATFHCGDETIKPKPGDAFWFNRKRLHWVENHGRAERLHLILDLEAPQYLAQRGLYVQLEDVRDAWPEMHELYREHYEEIAFYKDIALAPDEDTYMDLAPSLRVYTVRDAGALVGYAMFLVRPNPHYRASLTATQDVLFLKKEYRRGMTGVRLLRHAEDRLRAEGVQVVYHHAKRTNRVGELLERLGYDLVDTIWAKRLDKKKGE